MYRSSILLSFMALLALVSCGGGGSESNPGQTPGPASSNYSGSFLNETVGGVAELINFSTGQVRQIPSYESGEGWNLSRPGGRFVTKSDYSTYVDVYDTGSFVRTGGFRLSQVPNDQRGDIAARALPSFDGQYVLAYYSPTGDLSKKLTVFRTDGTIVQSGSAFSYSSLGYNISFDWIPGTHKYAYLAGDRVVVATVGSDIERSATLELPPNVISDFGGELHASPDGSTLLISLQTKFPQSAWPEEVRNLIYAITTETGVTRQVTRLTQAAADSVLTSNHVGAAWLPDGSGFVFYISSAPPGVLISPTMSSNYYNFISQSYGNLPASCSPYIVASLGEAKEYDLDHLPSETLLYYPGQSKPVVGCDNFGSWSGP